MMKMALRLLAMAAIFLVSCSKEFSDESGGGLGRVCRLQSIIAVDNATGFGIYALNTGFNISGLANYVQAYDSMTGNVDYEVMLQYQGDTVKTSLNEILTLDRGTRLVTRLTSPLDPLDPGGGRLVFNYRYDGKGYLVEKTLTTSSVPVPILKVTYTWTGANLTRIESFLTTLAGPEKFLQVNMEYDITKRPRSFIPIYPEGFESFLYITSLNFGQPSLNLIKKISITYFDNNGNPLPPVESTIRDVVFSNDGYITEWFVEGGSFDALGLFSGRNRFLYKCS
jgi:hypothetical protein